MAWLTAIPARHQMLTWDQAKLWPRVLSSPGNCVPRRARPCTALALRPVPPVAGSALQFVINLTGIVAAGCLVLVARGHSRADEFSRSNRS
jgi:hypothetical protein